MKKFIFLSFAIICMGRAIAGEPHKFTIKIPKEWKGEASKNGYSNLLDVLESDTIANEIMFFSPDGVKLATLYINSCPSIQRIEALIPKLDAQWESIRLCKSYHLLVKEGKL